MKLGVTTAAAMMFVPIISCAQEQARTDSGRTVILNKNGTWEYLSATEGKIKQREETGNRSADATERFDIPSSDYQLRFDPRKWKQVNSETGRTTFQHRNGDGYGVVIAEPASAPIENAEHTVLANARTTDPGVEILLEETRVINGTKILCRQFRGTMEGIPFTYFGAYFSGQGGNVQVLTFTAANRFKEYKPDFEEFMNGLVALDSQADD